MVMGSGHLIALVLRNIPFVSVLVPSKRHARKSVECSLVGKLEPITTILSLNAPEDG